MTGSRIVFLNLLFVLGHDRIRKQDVVHSDASDGVHPQCQHLAAHNVDRHWSRSGVRVGLRGTKQCDQVAVWPVKSCQIFTRKMKDFEAFTKIALQCGWFGQNNCCRRLFKVAQLAINHPILAPFQVATVSVQYLAFRHHENMPNGPIRYLPNSLFCCER